MKKTLLILTFFTIILSACSPLAGSELDRNRQKWIRAGIHHYRFEINVGCFCAFTQRMPLTIEVKDGLLLSMAYSDGKTVPQDERQPFANYQTIDSLFDFTASAISDADQIQIEYDPKYGYPASVQIDFIRNAADDELSLSIVSFEVLP